MLISGDVQRFNYPEIFTALCSSQRLLIAHFIPWWMEPNWIYSFFRMMRFHCVQPLVVFFLLFLVIVLQQSSNSLFKVHGHVIGVCPGFYFLRSVICQNRLSWISQLTGSEAKTCWTFVSPRLAELAPITLMHLHRVLFQWLFKMFAFVSFVSVKFSVSLTMLNWRFSKLKFRQRFVP